LICIAACAFSIYAARGKVKAVSDRLHTEYVMSLPDEDG
jgi:hypothetical protein